MIESGDHFGVPAADGVFYSGPETYLHKRQRGSGGRARCDLDKNCLRLGTSSSLFPQRENPFLHL